MERELFSGNGSDQHQHQQQHQQQQQQHEQQRRKPQHGIQNSMDSDASGGGSQNSHISTEVTTAAVASAEPLHFAVETTVSPASLGRAPFQSVSVNSAEASVTTVSNNHNNDGRISSESGAVGIRQQSSPGDKSTRVDGSSVPPSSSQGIDGCRSETKSSTFTGQHASSLQESQSWSSSLSSSASSFSDFFGHAGTGVGVGAESKTAAPAFSRSGDSGLGFGYRGWRSPASAQRCWRRVRCLGDIPGPRSGAASVVVGNRMFMFGGYGGSGRLDDFYEFNFDTKVWSRVKYSGPSPGVRENNGVVEYKGCLYLFGGYNGSQWLNDFHEFSLTTCTWRTVQPKGQPPASRFGYVSVVHANRFVLFGGYDGTTWLNDMHEYNFDTQMWSRIAATGRAPSIRSCPSWCKEGNRVFVFGGYDGVRRMNDFFACDLDTYTWSQIPHCNGTTSGETTGGSGGGGALGTNIISIGSVGAGLGLRGTTLSGLVGAAGGYYANSNQNQYSITGSGAGAGLGSRSALTGRGDVGSRVGGLHSNHHMAHLSPQPISSNGYSLGGFLHPTSVVGAGSNQNGGARGSNLSPSSSSSLGADQHGSSVEPTPPPPPPSSMSAQRSQQPLLSQAQPQQPQVGINRNDLSSNHHRTNHSSSVGGQPLPPHNLQHGGTFYSGMEEQLAAGPGGDQYHGSNIQFHHEQQQQQQQQQNTHRSANSDSGGGGVSARTYLDDAHEVPSPRYFHACAMYNGKMYTFGGYNGTERLNDMYEYDFQTLRWAQVHGDSSGSSSAGSEVPSGRSSLVSQVYKNSLYIFGGYNGQVVLNDFYEFRFEPVVIPPPSLIEDMRALVNNKDYSDVTFIVDGLPAYASRVHLAARSEHFRAMLYGGMRESFQENCHEGVELKDVSYAVFLKILEFLYTDTVLEIPPDVAVPLLIAAEQYLLLRLKGLCEDAIRKGITSANVIPTFLASHRHRAAGLKEICLDFLLENLDEVKMQKTFSELKAEPDLLMEIIMRQPS